MISRSVSPKDLGKFEKKLAAALSPSKIARAQVASGNEIVRMLRSRSARVRYLGRYSTGWVSSVNGTRLTVKNVTRHAINVEKGRRAGAKMPPLKIIRKWVVFHGMPPSAAFPIARAIAIRGIKARPLLTADSTVTEMRRIVKTRLQRYLDTAIRSANA